MRSTQSLRMHTAAATVPPSPLYNRTQSSVRGKIRQCLGRCLRHCGRAPNESDAIGQKEKYASIGNSIKNKRIEPGVFSLCDDSDVGSVGDLPRILFSILYCDRRNLESRKSAANVYRGIWIHVRQPNHLSLCRIIYCTRTRGTEIIFAGRQMLSPGGGAHRAT